MITYNENYHIFQLDTKRTSYLIGIVDTEHFPMHVYYGPKIAKDQDMLYLLRIGEAPFVPSLNDRERGSFMDCASFEYPCAGLGDYRHTALSVEDKDGQVGCELCEMSFEVIKGKPALEGIPATFAGRKEDCETLILHCRDPYLNLEADLFYSVFYEEDCIARRTVLKNKGKEELKLQKALSASIDLDNRNFEVLTLSGSWARERSINRIPLCYGKFSIASIRGESSHQEQPFIAFVTPDTDETRGEVYAMHFIYSGNFEAAAEMDQFEKVRMSIGIAPEQFSWTLEPGGQFATPEAILTYSDRGLGQMSRNLHDLYRDHLIRSRYLHQARPVLLNSWEAAYFDFDEAKLLKIAKEAKKCGIEMLVMDDGWFGHRNSDDSSLGDWYADKKKLPGDLAHLSDEIHALGLKFGIWMEPEMISPDSELYRKHPDWAISLKTRPATKIRAQYVLDLSREDVLDYVWNSISNVLKSAKIEYLKWDMNRPLTDLGSNFLPPDRQGELSHRYVLGLYELQEKLVTEFPDLLLENCSSGGARFDPGMLYYSPQIWCSDDTDAIERLKIQEGTELLYPLSTIGAHISACPNHTVGRNTPFSTRCNAALAGTFGYELDVTKLGEEKKEIPYQIGLYKRFGELVREGDYYRIASYSCNHEYDLWMVVSKDKTEALVTFVQGLMRPNDKSRIIRLEGLDEEKTYRIEWLHDAPEHVDRGYQNPDQLKGDILMHAGLLIPTPWGDFQSRLIHLTEIAE